MFETPPGVIPESALHNAKSFNDFHPGLVADLEKKFPTIRLKSGGFDNLMPLILAGVSPHVLMTFIMAGENWDTALIDLAKAHALTHNDGILKPNVARLGVLSPHIDSRQDKPSLKPVPGHPGEFAIVGAQTSWTKGVLVPMMEIAGVDYVVQLDGHSYIASEQFNKVGIETVNLTTAFLMIEEIRSRGLLNNDLENVICGVDLGNLPLVQTIRNKLDMEVALMSKKRVPVGEGEKSDTIHEFIYGDVKGKRVILIDDMISTGGTLLRTVKLLLEQGAKEIIVCAAHPVFSADYYTKLQNLLAFPEVKIVMTTNTLPLKRPGLVNDKDLPYIKVSGSDYPNERKQVQMLDIDQNMSIIVQALLASNTTAEIRESLSGLQIVQSSPKKIYHEITRNTLEEPRITHRYEEGEFIPL